VQRQSFYNAFDGKQELFVAALLKFDTVGEFEARETPLNSIREILDLAVDDLLKHGCFRVNTALEIQGHEEEILQIITEGVEQFRSFYKRLIEKGQELGEIPLRVNSSAAASMLLAALFGMRVMARGTVEKETLHQVANQAMQIIS